MSNDTRRAHGRMCNHIIRNIICSELARKHDLKFIYGYAGETKAFGVDLFETGTQFHKPIMYLHESNIADYLSRSEINFNLFACEEFYQGKYSANFVRSYFNRNKDRIISANKFKERYDRNSDVFVHVRLGDVSNLNPGFAYYDEMLNVLAPYNHGYIASDSIDHPICQRLIEKHGLTPVTLDPVETIMFGSTCRYHILSVGTYSWMIGVTGYYSTVFFPNYRDKESFCPYDLFDFPDWNSVDYLSETEDMSNSASMKPE